MPMTADSSSIDAARRTRVAYSPRQAPQKTINRPVCAHPIVFGSIATLSLMPLLASAHHGFLHALPHPTAMVVGGWLGARWTSQSQQNSFPMARLVGTNLGAVMASGAVHFLHSAGGAPASAAWLLMRALGNAAMGGCCAMLGGLLGASSWSGFSAPMGDGVEVLAAALLGAYAFSNLALAPLDNGGP
jgi:hypothetical protein